MIRRSFGERVFDATNVIMFTAFSIMIILPFLRMLTFSFSTDTMIAKDGFHLFPTALFPENWITVLTSSKVWTAFANTVIVTCGATAFQLFLATTFAYPLSRRDLPNRRLWTSVLLLTMFFGGGLIPTFLLYKSLGLLNSLYALILGGVSAWNTLILRNFFMTVPESLQESARIDGANDIRIYFRIILPLSLPALATITLWLVVTNWNSWYSSMIYITDQNKQVLQMILRQIIIENSLNVADVEGSLRRMETATAGGDKYTPPSVEGLKAAALLFVTVPILFTYPFLQKYFVKGLLMGSLKG